MNKLLLKQYNKEEIKELLENKTKLVYIDIDMEEIVARYKDLPDIIVDINNKLGSTNLKVYDYSNSFSTPILTTIGFFLDKCDKKVREDIIDRLVELQTLDVQVRDYKIIKEDMLEDIRTSLEQNEETER